MWLHGVCMPYTIQHICTKYKVRRYFSLSSIILLHVLTFLFFGAYLLLLSWIDRPLQCSLDLPLCFLPVSFYKSWLVQYTATGGQCYQRSCIFWSLCHACSLVEDPQNIYSAAKVEGG